MSAQQTSGGVRLNACKLCGDCATGCNQGAKESLDTNLLASAFVAGVKIYCGATVLRIEPGDPDGWRVLVTHTDVSRRLAEGAAMAGKALDSGQAKATLGRLKEVSNRG